MSLLLFASRVFLDRAASSTTVALSLIPLTLSPSRLRPSFRPVRPFQEGLLRQKNQLDAYVAWHRRLGQAPTLDEMMRLPSTNERWAQEGHMGALPGAPKVTVILNLFKREVRREAKRSEGKSHGTVTSKSNFVLEGGGGQGKSHGTVTSEEAFLFWGEGGGGAVSCRREERRTAFPLCFRFYYYTRDTTWNCLLTY